jgi:hypothetical protein
MSNVLNIACDQGSTLVYTFTLQDQTNVALNLTGYDARMQVRKSYGASTVEINCTLANGKLAITNATGGVLTLTLAPADTSSIRFAAVNDDSIEMYYDLEIQSGAGAVYKAAKGTFTLSREVTR